MKPIAIFILITCTIRLFAQDSNGLTIGGYADGYYSWYSNATDLALQQHDCIGAYHNNFGLNVAQASLSYHSKWLRGKTTLHVGDIPQITWADQYRNLQEAHVGVRLAKRFWLDAGFFKTHVGTESFLPKDNLMSILSLATFYGPFYQSGARLIYDTKNQWHLELHAINGYNLHVDNNDYKSFGVLVSKEVGERWMLSYSNLVGSERIGSLNDDYLFYQNVYANFTGGKLELQFGADGAFAVDRGFSNEAFGPLLAVLATVKYHLSDRFSVALRGEVFSDIESINSGDVEAEVSPIRNGATVVGWQSFNSSGPGSDAEQTVFGATVSFEYRPSDFGFLRIESRVIYDQEDPTEYPEYYTALETGLNPALQYRIQALMTLGVYFNHFFALER